MLSLYSSIACHPSTGHSCFVLHNATLHNLGSHTPAGVISPVWVDAQPSDIADPETYVCRHLVVLDAPLSAESDIAAHFALNAVHFTEGRFSFITDEMSEAAVKEKIAEIGYPLVTRIRVL